LYLPSNSFTKSLIDCSEEPCPSDHLETVIDGTTSSHSQTTEHSAAATDENCSVTLSDSQSESCRDLLSYKEIFLKHKRIFCEFANGQCLTTSVISGYSNRITAIDYHNGFLATGKKCAVC